MRAHARTLPYKYKKITSLDIFRKKRERKKKEIWCEVK